MIILVYFDRNHFLTLGFYNDVEYRYPPPPDLEKCMKRTSLLGVLILMIVGVARADDSSTQQKDHPDMKQRMENRAERRCPEGDQQCVQKREGNMKDRAEKMKKRVEEKCKGDEKCIAEHREKFKEKRQQIHDEIAKQCPDKEDKQCRKDAFQKMKEDFKSKREEHKQNKEAPTT